MKVRQFVNLVTEKCSGRFYDEFMDKAIGGLYTLRRIKADKLFYGSTEEALQKESEQEAMAADPCKKEMVRSRLPNPLINFNQSRPVDGRTDFWPFYGAANQSSKILCLDAAGQAVLYDAGDGALETLPCLRAPMGGERDDPVVLSVALPGGTQDPARPDALYVMDKRHGSFEALIYGDPSPYRLGHCVWWWRQLPMPPFARDPTHGSIVAYALLADDDGGTICVSSYTDKVGTYCFNTASERWIRVGSWTLPFHGRGQVVPELDGLCFGVASQYPCHMCAVDLSSISTDSARRPKLRHQWEVMDTPAGWSATNVSMSYMGAARFCIAKSFYIDGQDEDEMVLNGVEVVRENNGARTSKSKHRFRMIKHKSIRYRLRNHRIRLL
ncbi:unnamed protein product [Alopecurus aequalis]